MSDAIHLRGCGTRLGYVRGDVIRNPFRTGDEPRYLVVTASESRYLSEDAMSFGDDDDCGYVASVTCRAATDEEAAPLIAADEEARQRAAAERRRRALATDISTHGIRPERAEPAGETLLDTSSIYGGGNWFVLETDRVWFVQNNGGDGDDWSLNNVRTGGAGAIGWYVPRTDDVTAELDAIERVLDPAAADRRRYRADGAAAYRLLIGDRLDARVWGEGCEPAAGRPRAAWVRLGGDLYGAIDHDGHPWLAVTGRATDDLAGRLDILQIESGSVVGNERAVGLRYAPTPERLAQITAAYPDWLSPAFVEATENANDRARSAEHAAQETYRAEYAAAEERQRDLYGRQSDLHRYKYIEPERYDEGEYERVSAVLRPVSAEVERLRTAMYDAGYRAYGESLADAPTGAVGRYTLPHGNGYAASARATVIASSIWGYCVNDIQVEPGIAMLAASGESRWTGRPFALWSDGEATTGALFTPYREQSGATMRLSATARLLLGPALRQSEWRSDGRWRDLLEVDEIEADEQLDRSARSGASSSEEHLLSRLTVRLTNGQDRTLYCVSTYWGAMGEDGDAGDDAFIYDDERAARDRFRDQIQLYRPTARR